MRSIFKKAGNLLLPLVLLAVLIGLNKTGQKGITFAETSWDFGKINAKEKLEHKFSFKNTSDSIIQIIDIVPSCGCMAAFPGDKFILPGEYGFIDVTFNPVGKKNNFSSIILVETDEKKPSYLLRLEATIVRKPFSKIKFQGTHPSITVEPTNINLGNIKLGDKALYNIVIGNSGDGDLFIKNIGAQNEAGISLKKKPIKKGKRIELTAFYEAKSKGKIGDYIKISSNDPNRPLVKVRITGNIE
ncbi:MAG: DUF1573 domain-containing protein [Nitrospinota bacterium]